MTLHETIEYVDSLDADERSALIERLAPLLLGDKHALEAAIRHAQRAGLAEDIDQEVADHIAETSALDAEIAAAEIAETRAE